MSWEDAGAVRGAQLRWRALALPLLEADAEGGAECVGVCALPLPLPVIEAECVGVCALPLPLL